MIDNNKIIFEKINNKWR